MKTAMKNKIKIGVLIGIIVLVVFGYFLAQGSALTQTDKVLQKVEKKIITQSLAPEEAKELRNQFLALSEKARENALDKQYAMHDLSALLQAHLTAIDVLDNSKFEESTVIVRDALIGKIVEIEAVLLGDVGPAISAEEGINGLVSEIDATLSEFKDAQGVIPARMFDEAQVAIQQAGSALAEAQASLAVGMEKEASIATLRARRFIIEARYTISLAQMMQKEMAKLGTKDGSTE
jgi:hypothetical protein